MEIKIVFNIEEHTNQFYKFIFFIQPQRVKYLKHMNDGDIAKDTSFANHLDCPYAYLLSKPSIRFADERFSICSLRLIKLPRFQMKKPPNFVGGLVKILVNRIGLS